jgi:lipopolysaccharide heptosyltransferase II
VIYFEHSGSELQRGLNMLRFARLLRRRRFRTVWILDYTVRAAMAASLARIPERIGVGMTSQRFYITNKGIDRSHLHDFPIAWLIALMADMNVPLPTTEPNLPVPSHTLAAIAEKFAVRPRPWIVLGLGASHPDKDWTDEYWTEFLAGLRRRASGTLFLIGGAAQIARAAKLIANIEGANTVNACDLKLIESCALLRHADLFIGTDSGPLNLAAAAETEAFGLFGGTRVLTYSKFIHPVVPDNGLSPDGMRRILPNQVLAQIEPSLSRRKERA